MAARKVANGTFETCRPAVTMSGSEGRPEVVGQRQNDAIREADIDVRSDPSFDPKAVIRKANKF